MKTKTLSTLRLFFICSLALFITSCGEDYREIYQGKYELTGFRIPNSKFKTVYQDTSKYHRLYNLYEDGSLESFSLEGKKIILPEEGVIEYWEAKENKIILVYERTKPTSRVVEITLFHKKIREMDSITAYEYANSEQRLIDQNTLVFDTMNIKVVKYESVFVFDPSRNQFIDKQENKRDQFDKSSEWLEKYGSF
jgi:hypothetical protein